MRNKRLPGSGLAVVPAPTSFRLHGGFLAYSFWLSRLGGLGLSNHCRRAARCDSAYRHYHGALLILPFRAVNNGGGPFGRLIHGVDSAC